MCRCISTVYRSFYLWANWVNLSKFRNSFLSKATTAFSLGTFGLANLAKPLQTMGVDSWRLALLFVGSTFFLLGYIFIGFQTPAEFNGATNIIDIVDQMTKIADFDFFRSRNVLCGNLLTRFKGSKKCSLLQPQIDHAQEKHNSANALCSTNWNDSAGALFHADLVLRQYDRTISRVIGVLLLGSGIVIMLCPTLVSVCHATANLGASFSIMISKWMCNSTLGHKSG
jgi:hypothetical protein